MTDVLCTMYIILKCMFTGVLLLSIYWDCMSGGSKVSCVACAFFKSVMTVRVAQRSECSKYGISSCTCGSPELLTNIISITHID